MERNFDPAEVSNRIIQGISSSQDLDQVSQQFGGQLWEVGIKGNLSWPDLLEVIEVAEKGGKINPDLVSRGYLDAALT